MKSVVRPLFYRDIEEEVYWLLQTAGPEAAQRWHESLWRSVELLKTFPYLGRKRSDLKYPGVRSWRVEHFPRWLIFYGVRDGVLILYRVRSGTMNLAAIKVVS